MSGPKHSIADMLNRGCDCAVTDLPKLRERIDSALEPAQSILEQDASAGPIRHHYSILTPF